MTYKLCFIKEPWAYFTKLPVIGKGSQNGDDWNDIPYAMNACPPYGDKPGDIVKVAYVSDLQTPDGHHYGAPYSVDMINAGVVPWLMDYYINHYEGAEDIRIMGGCALDDFVRIVTENGGEIYLLSERRGPSVRITSRWHMEPEDFKVVGHKDVD